MAEKPNQDILGDAAKRHQEQQKMPDDALASVQEAIRELEEKKKKEKEKFDQKLAENFKEERQGQKKEESNYEKMYYDKQDQEEKEELDKKLAEAFEEDRKNQEEQKSDYEKRYQDQYEEGLEIKKVTLPKDSERAVDLEKEVQVNSIKEITEKIEAIEKEIEKKKKEILDSEEQVKKLDKEIKLKPDYSIERAQVESQIQVKNNEIDQLRAELSSLDGDLNQLNYYKKNRENILKVKKKSSNGLKLGLGIAGFAFLETIKTSWEILRVTGEKIWDEISKLTGAGGFWENSKKMFKRFWKGKKGAS